MAMGRFPTRTIFVEVGTMRGASDLGGIHAVRMNEGPECRRDLAKRLADAGCEVNDDGTDWLSAGEYALRPQVEVFNQLLDEVGLEDLPRARIATSSKRSGMRTGEMRMLLNQARHLL